MKLLALEDSSFVTAVAEGLKVVEGMSVAIEENLETSRTSLDSSDLETRSVDSRHFEQQSISGTPRGKQQQRHYSLSTLITIITIFLRERHSILSRRR